jgi:hypothetical protein
MKKSRILLLILSIWLTALPVHAALVKADHTLLFSIPVEEDVYLAGGKVIVESEIDGDAVIMGGDLLVNGAVRQDLLIAGGNVTINGEVGGDVRAAGGDVTISRDIAEDLVVCGGNVIVGPGVTVGGDLLEAGWSSKGRSKETRKFTAARWSSMVQSSVTPDCGRQGNWCSTEICRAEPFSPPRT